MTDGSDLRPSRVWQEMSERQREAAARAFWGDDESGGEQAEVLMQMARQLNFRPKSVQALPIDRKVKFLTTRARLSEAAAARILVAYHLACQRPMMGAFLDKLGIAHQNGLIKDEQIRPPDAARLASVAEELRAAYPAEDVRLYFDTLKMQDPEAWGALPAVERAG